MPVRLSYKLYFFSQRIVFFSHNKSVNSTFNHGLSAKRTVQRILSRLALAIITEYHAGAGLSLDASGLNGERSNVVIRVATSHIFFPCKKIYTTLLHVSVLCHTAARNGERSKASSEWA